MIERAEAAAREALALREAKLPPEHWQVAQVKSLLGACLAARGRGAEARAMLRSSHAVLAAKLGEHHAITEKARRWLIAVEADDPPRASAVMH